MLGTIITAVITAIVIIAIAYIISIWIYKRSPSNMAFIRTGFLGTKVCLGRGALVLPVFHEVSWVSLETIKLIVGRTNDQAVLTADNIRVDITAELYTHVGHTEAEILTASRSLGEKTFDSEGVRNLLEAKVVSQLRSDAATKTLQELHQNRDTFARDIKSKVIESFQANGLNLEEVTIVSLEQSGKEYFRTDNVFDAEGLKIITEITSGARRKVHETEKRTNVAIRQKDLDTQLEMLEIEKNEAFARANQDREVSNEQALQLSEKQKYVLDQRRAVEEREIGNDKELERMRTEREVAITEEAQKRETTEIRKNLAIEQEQRDREIALIAKAKEEELANISRNLELEKAEKDRKIELIAKSRDEELTEIERTLSKERAEKEREIELSVKERERQQAEITRNTEVMKSEELARDARHKAAEDATITVRRRSLDTKLAVLLVEKDEEYAKLLQDQEISNERARILSEKQRFIIDKRWEVEQEEIIKEQSLEQARIQKDTAIIGEAKVREAAEIRRGLAREQEERDREVALLVKAEEVDSATTHRNRTRESNDRDRQVAIIAKDEEVRRAEVRQGLAIELEEREREISLINKESERELADIQRYLSREKEERDREIALAGKLSELEAVETKRLQITAQREQAEHGAESVRVVADAEREKEVRRIGAERDATSRRIDEENKAEITRMHMLTQSEARKLAAEQEAEATLTRARATSEAQKINAEGIEREAGATGRAEMEIEMLRTQNVQRRLEAEAAGIESKADALKQYDESAAFLELAQLHIAAERDIHIDQAKAMGSALSQAQIRMYGGGGGGGDGTIDTIRGMFTSGFALGEVLEGVAQSLPEGIRRRFSDNGIRGLFGKPHQDNELRQHIEAIRGLVQGAMPTRKDRQVPFNEAINKLEEAAGDDASVSSAVLVLKDMNEGGMFDEVQFEQVWALLQAATKNGG